jgi:hypothetical protein
VNLEIQNPCCDCSACVLHVNTHFATEILTMFDTLKLAALGRKEGSSRKISAFLLCNVEVIFVVVIVQVFFPAMQNQALNFVDIMKLVSSVQEEEARYLVGEGDEVTNSMSSFEGIHSILQPTEEATRDFLVEVEDAETQVSRTLSVKLIDLIHTEGLNFVCKIKYMNFIS